MFIMLVYIGFALVLTSAERCPNNCTCEMNPHRFMVLCTRAGYTTLPTSISENVTILHLPSNKIKRLDSKVFSKYKKLQYVSFANNRIEEVHPNALVGLTSLVRLDLSGNRITYFPWSSITSTPMLSFLVLNNNLLTNVPVTTVLEKLNSLKTFRIHGNNLRCSCEFQRFADWIKENKEKSRRGTNFVTVAKVDRINCTSLLRWVVIPILKIHTVATKQLGSRRVCRLPFIEIHATTLDQREFARYNKTTLLPYEPMESTKDQEPNNVYHLRFLGEYTLTAQDTKLTDNNTTPHIQLPDLHTTKKKYFRIAEGSAVKITCNVTNRGELSSAARGDRARIAVVPKITATGTDIEQVTDWRTKNEVVILHISRDLHDHQSVICAAENIAGTVTKEIEIVVTGGDSTVQTDFVRQRVTATPSTRTPHDVEHREKESRTATDHGTTIPSHQIKSQISTTTLMPHNETHYKSLCTEDYNYAVLHISATSHKGMLYRYSYDDLMNVTMEVDKVQGVIVTITTNSSSLGTVFICHSHGASKLKRWSYVKKGSEKHFIRSASVVKPFIVCVMSQFFHREVCGNFTVKRNIGKSMVVMGFVGGTLILLGTVPMIIAALHNVYTKNTTKSRKQDKIRSQNYRDDLQYDKMKHTHEDPSSKTSNSYLIHPSNRCPDVDFVGDTNLSSTPSSSCERLSMLSP